MDAIQQRLQADPKFRQAYPMQVAREMQGEKQLEAQLAKQVRLVLRSTRFKYPRILFAVLKLMY